MTAPTIIFLCLHCFCFGGVVFGLTSKEKHPVGLAVLVWAIISLINFAWLIVAASYPILT